jgi:hypothetical protein
VIHRFPGEPVLEVASGEPDEALHTVVAG